MKRLDAILTGMISAFGLAPSVFARDVERIRRTTVEQAVAADARNMANDFWKAYGKTKAACEAASLELGHS